MKMIEGELLEVSYITLHSHKKKYTTQAIASPIILHPADTWLHKHQLFTVYILPVHIDIS